MAEQLPKIEVSDAQPLAVAELRDHVVLQTADPLGEVPDVQLASGPLNPHDRPHRNSTRIGISDVSGEDVGTFNLVQTGERSWLGDVRIIEARRGEKLGVATYLGVLSALHTVGRTLRSDPGGLSDDSTRVWQSLVRRGVAQSIDGEVDQHGNPRFISKTL